MTPQNCGKPQIGRKYSQFIYLRKNWHPKYTPNLENSVTGKQATQLKMSKMMLHFCVSLLMAFGIVLVVILDITFIITVDPVVEYWVIGSLKR